MQAGSTNSQPVCGIAGRGGIGVRNAMVVSTLRFADPVKVDVTRLRAICERMGLVDGEAAICAAMEDLAGHLMAASLAWSNGNLGGLRKAAGSAAEKAASIGLNSLARVARDLEALCEGGGDAALAAVAARLERMGENSLIAIWDAQDVSG